MVYDKTNTHSRVNKCTLSIELNYNLFGVILVADNCPDKILLTQ